MGAWRRRIRAWWFNRLPTTESSTLTQRNVYILPTPAGWAFGLTLLVLLVASINDQLNLGYALTFLLAGSALASMHMSHATLRGLTLHLRPVAAAHVGQEAHLELVFTNTGPTRHGVGARLVESSDDTLAYCEVEAGAQTVLSIRCPCAERGHQTLPLLLVESRFPLGLFRVWTIWRPAGRHWVYPALLPSVPAWPDTVSTDRPRAGTAPREGSEFDGVRPWHPLDSPRRIVWKKVARGGEWVSRDLREHQAADLWLDWQHAGGTGVEARLSCLATWVQQAEASGAPWGLRLPGRTLSPASGAAHRHAALQTLAQWNR